MYVHGNHAYGCKDCSEAVVRTASSSQYSCEDCCVTSSANERSKEPQASNQRGHVFKMVDSESAPVRARPQSAVSTLVGKATSQGIDSRDKHVFTNSLVSMEKLDILILSIESGVRSRSIWL